MWKETVMWSCQHGDGADLEGGQEALVGPQRWPFGIAVVGGPTAVIDIASLTAERAAAAAGDGAGFPDAAR
jgi:hypothetical protein